MRILFLGEGPLNGSARYFASVLRWAKFPFDHCPDEKPLPAAWMRRRYDAVVLSDYRHSNFSKSQESWLCAQVRAGTGLLMIGGWASFTGLVGRYGGSAIERLLPVSCVRGDDRVNWASGSVLKVARPHRILTALPMGHLPVVCGYHRAHVKPGSRTILSLQHLAFHQGEPSLGSMHPGLVVRESESIRTAAFLTDCAPHWAGGLVDWGSRRVTVHVATGCDVEVGDVFLRFFKQLVEWTARR